MKFLKTHTGAMVVLAVVIVLSVLLGSHRSFISDDLQICRIEIIFAQYLLHKSTCVHALFPFCPFCLCRL